MLCEGHAAHSHEKQLKSLQKRKCFTQDEKDKYRKKYPKQYVIAPGPMLTKRDVGTSLMPSYSRQDQTFLQPCLMQGLMWMSLFTA